DGDVACVVFFFRAEDGIRDRNVTGVQTCALPILGLVPLQALCVGAAVVVEGAHAAALGDEAVEVDVRDGGAGALREALRLPQQVAALVDEGLAVPGEVGGGFALAGRGVEVRGLGAGGGGAGHEFAVLGAADRDR